VGRRCIYRGIGGQRRTPPPTNGRRSEGPESCTRAGVNKDQATVSSGCPTRC